VLPLTGGEDARFGWKTTNPAETPHFMDDAVWFSWYTEDWQPMAYPDQHVYQGQSIDLAFVITPEPATLALVGLGTLVITFKRRRSA